MPSIFDTILGRNQSIASPPIVPQPPSMLNPLDDTPSARDTLLGLSQGLIAAGAPSPYPVDFGQTLGKAITGAAGANDEDKRLKRALVGAQVATAQDKIKQRQALSKLLLDGGRSADTPSAVAADPTNPVGGIAGGGPSNPTNPGNLANGQGGFQQFKTPEEGVAAAVKLAQQFPATYNNGQPMTLAQIESHWAPPDDGKDPMTRGNKPGVWSTNVARAMGVDPNVPVDFSNPANGLAFAKAVHQAEHPPGSAYAPDVYQRGTQLAYGGMPQAPVTGAAVVQPPASAPPSPTVPAGSAARPVPISNAMPGQAVPQQVANPIAQGDGPQPGAAPGAPPAQPNPVPAAPPPNAGAPAAQNIRQVIQGLKPAERQLLATMDPEDVTKFLLQRAAPNHETVLDTTDGTVKFVDKTDPLIGSRYQPVKAAELGISMRQAAAQERQAAAREFNAKGENANRPIMVDEAGNPTVNTALPGAKAAITAAEEAAKRKAETEQLTDPNYAGGKAGVAGAEAAAKVPPRLLELQGEEVSKRHELAQTAAQNARVGISNLDRLGSLLGQVQTGKFTGTTQDLKAAAKSAGFDLDSLGIKDNVGTGQAAQALSQAMALQLRDPSAGGGMPGSLSDGDRKFLAAMVPNITNDPNGNKLMLDYQKKLYQRTIDTTKIVNDYIRSPDFLKDPAGVYAKVQTFADEHPLFDPTKDAPKSPPVTPAGGVSLDAIDAEIQRRKGAK